MNQLMVKQTRGLLEKSIDQLRIALPAHVAPEHVIRVTMTELQERKELQNCEPRSVVGSVIKAAELGLDVGSAKGHAYLVPYGKKAQLIVGYRGYIELARRSGDVTHVSARVVRKGDHFKVKYGLDETIEHEPAFEDSEITHVYAVAHFKNGEKLFDVMPAHEITAIQKRSKTGNSGPWKTDTAEMSRKSVVRRLAKYIPMSSELADAMALDEAADRGEQDNSALVVNAEGTPREETSAERLKKKVQGVEEREVVTFENAPTTLDAPVEAQSESSGKA